MSSKALIDRAVFNSSTAGLKGVADRLFAHWFSRLVYAHIWEDPQADLQALQLKAGARILTISSGGCNALAYLTTDPAAVHAVDLNATHLAMLNLKQQAIKHLADYQAVLAFLGHANHPDNRKRFLRHIRPHLDANAQQYWLSRSFNGRPRYHYFCRQAYRHGLMGRFIGFAHWYVKLLGGDLGKLMQAKNLQEQKSLFDLHISPVFDNPLFRLIAAQPVTLYSLGIPPAQFEQLKQDSGGDIHSLFKERIRHLACDFPLNENCFAQQAFGRRYDTEQQAALPMYLQQQQYPALRRNIDRLHAHHCTLTEFLRQQADGSMDAYVLLDAQDWMDQAQLTELWSEINRTASPAARVVFRTGGSQSPLEKQLPPALLRHWQTSSETNQALYAMDRSAIYGGMHLYRKI